MQLLALGLLSLVYGEPVVLPSRVRATPLRETSTVIKKALSTAGPTDYQDADFIRLSGVAVDAIKEADKACLESERLCQHSTSQMSGLSIYSEVLLAKTLQCSSALSCWTQFDPISLLKQTTSTSNVVGYLMFLRETGRLTAKTIDFAAWTAFFDEWQSLTATDDWVAHLHLIHAKLLVADDKEKAVLDFIEFLTDPNLTSAFLSWDSNEKKAKFLRDITMVLKSAPVTDEIRGFRFGIGEVLVRTLSKLKVKVQSVATLDSCVAGLIHLDQAGGLLSLVITKEGTEFDATLGSALRKPVPQYELNLAKADQAYWTMIQESENAFLIKPSKHGKKVPSFDIVKDQEIITSVQPDNVYSTLTANCMPRVFRKTNEKWDSVTDAIEESILMVQMPCVGAPAAINVCPKVDTRCTTVQTVLSPFGFPMSLIDPSLVTLGSSGFTVTVAGTSVGEFQTTAKDQSPSRVYQTPEGEFRLNTELDYMFQKEHPGANWLGVFVFTLAPLASPLAVWWYVFDGGKLTVPGAKVKGSILYWVWAVLVSVFGLSLIYYWAAWKLIPYSQFLVGLMIFIWICHP